MEEKEETHNFQYFQSCLVPPSTDCHPWSPSQMWTSWALCHLSVKGRVLSSSCWKQMASLPPFVVPKAPSAHLEFVWYNQFPGRRWSKKSQLPLPVTSPFPKSLGRHCSPTMWQLCVTAALCTNKTDYSNATVRKLLLLWSIHQLSQFG